MRAPTLLKGIASANKHKVSLRPRASGEESLQVTHLRKYYIILQTFGELQPAGRVFSCFDSERIDARREEKKETLSGIICILRFIAGTKFRRARRAEPISPGLNLEVQL
ncbi:hypothetical protein EVAR_83096_1 [Eumeta japonica]|uniref:Uncharacterized protein n=1 Tax=Eumeta variegata TaxID=151549 RepID=A0A4C1WQ53_EUMVA|nr:hypothetical protein EVAR_83096_1 [Eumeta japonica]